jgi:hypothetical protein
VVVFENLLAATTTEAATTSTTPETMDARRQTDPRRAERGNLMP